MRLLCAFAATAVLVAGCADDDPATTATPVAVACDAAPEILTTDDGVDFVRTPDACFENLPEWPYEARYEVIDGLRQAYAEAGPSDGPVVLLLHGQPSWSYLYRKMIPVLADAGYRVIAMDHLGMGRSDKPTDIASYSYLGHNERLKKFITQLGLTDINLFVQDWGSLIGLRVAGLHPEWFARIAVGNGSLPIIPEGLQPYPAVEDPDTLDETMPPLFADMPAQQVPFYDGCTLLLPADAEGGFGVWMQYAMTAAAFHPAEVLEALTWFDLPPEVEAAYDAPFPSRIYMGGPRTFPSLVNEVGGTTDLAWQGLTGFTRPFLTLWAANDPGNLGQCATQQDLIDTIPGAAGQPHDRLPEASHFLQDDQGVEIATRLVDFFATDTNTPPPPSHPLTRGTRYCELLFVTLDGTTPSASVWGTQGLNDCPAEVWDTLDFEAIKTEYGAFELVINGPRHWLVNGTMGGPSSSEIRDFGGLQMRMLATVTLQPGQTEAAAYSEIQVARNTTYTFNAGEEIYELTSPEGVVYVMQSMSLITHPDQTLQGLSTLSERLTLPQDWTYAARTLAEPLVMVATESATVLTDDLGNTYQKMGEGDGPAPTPTLPVLDDGTGTSCADDAACSGLDADACLVTSGAGFCTIEGCSSGGCGAPYVCCHSCNEQAAPLLPFEGSACLPEPATEQLVTIAGCTCD